MDDQTKRCPYCGEEIKAAAIKCRYCKQALNNNPLNNLQQKDENQNNSTKMIILIVVVIILGIIGISAYNTSQQNNQKAAQQALDICLTQAELQYQKNWASNCIKNADRITQGYNNCFSGEAFCRSLWGTPDPSPSCSLPTNMAEQIEEWRKEDKNECYYRYPLK